MEHGEFPAGKEDMKCAIECVVKKAELLDSNGNLDETKAKAIAAANPSNRFYQFLITEKSALETCKKANNGPPTCDSLHDLIKCLVNLHSGRKVRSALPVDLASKSKE